MFPISANARAGVCVCVCVCVYPQLCNSELVNRLSLEKTPTFYFKVSYNQYKCDASSYD